MERKYSVICYTTVDIKAPKMIFNENDTNTCKIEFTCYESDGVVLGDIANATVTITRPDLSESTYIVGQGIVIVGNVVTFTLPVGAINQDGQYSGQLYVYGSNNNRITISSFNYRAINEMINANTVPNDSQYPVLTSLINNVTNFEADVTENEATRTTSEGLRITAETSRATAEALRVVAENNRVSIENAIVTAENAREVVKNNMSSTITNFSNKGDFNFSTPYLPHNLVYYDSSTYMNIVACTGIYPTDETKWRMIARHGNNGFSSIEESTFTASSNNTTNIIHGLSEYNPLTDTLKVYGGEYESLLIEGENYTENANGLSVDLTGWSINTGAKVRFESYKNLDGNDIGNIVDLTTTNKTSLVNAINELDLELADNTNRNNSEAINVKFPGNGLTPAVGNGVADDTAVVQAILDFATTTRRSVYFPPGTYKVTGLIVKTTIFGENPYKSVIKNVSTVNPCIKIRAHWFDIRDLSIFGNGTVTAPSDATSGDGIYYDAPNSPDTVIAYVNITNCYIFRHGGHGITFSGHCFIININSCVCNFNKKNGINIDNSDGGQKNIINVFQCDLSDNDGNGILGFGTIININNNTIEGNLKKGISLDCEDTANVVASGVTVCNIKENYFELNKRGHIYVRGGVYTGSIYRDISNVSIVGNYGSQILANFETGYDTLVKVVSTGTQEYDSRIYNLRYDYNFFSLESGVVVFDGGNVLRDDNSTVYAPLNPPYYKNFGRSSTPSQLRYQAINGYFFAKGIAYTTPDKSDNVTTGTVIYYPLMLPTGAKLRRIYLYVNTDSTNYTIQIETIGRSGKTINAFTNMIISSNISANLSGNQLITSEGPENWGSNARIADDKSEAMLKITVTRTVVGTYLYLGSPELQYLD